jgi:aspartate/methionine/tyrosine aminotransferase
MTGWRIGYLAAPAQIISQALKASQNTITNVAPFIQYAAICALTNPDVSDFVKNMVHIYEERRNKSLEFLSSIKEPRLKILKPKGTFYLFLNLKKIGLPSKLMSEQLLEEFSVAMIPGSVFGECGEGLLRMTIAASEEDIMSGLERFTKWIQKNTK